MKVVIRTDASLEISTGHVIRCLTLARALRRLGVSCHFITRALPGNLDDRIAYEEFDMTLLPAPQGPAPNSPPVYAHWAGVDWDQDATETRVAFRDAPDWLVIDHYAFDARWQRKACPEGTLLMVIDDLSDRPHVCDVLLDQNLGHDASCYDGLVPDDCTRLTGPSYALLRPEFAEARAEALIARAGRGLKRLMVSMGGIDAVDATSLVLEALRGGALPEGLQISVIMGGNAPALEKVRALAKTMQRPTEVSVDVNDMATHMAAADLAIGAGGSTTWERCCLGLPTIIVEIAENQSGITRAMVEAGAALNPGPLQSTEFTPNLRAALAEAADPARLSTLSKNSAKICDGDGVERILSILAPTEVSFRPATRADSRRVWEWRRTLDRAFGLAGEDTPYSSHDTWFRRAVGDSDRIIYIAMLGQLPCGYLRLDPTGSARARVSLCLSPEVQGQGLGRRILAEADRLGTSLGFERLDAEIHPENRASRIVFEAAGYMQGDPLDGFLICHRYLKGKK